MNLFRLFGIQLSIHASFILLLVYYGWQGWQLGGPIGMAWSVALIVLFFGCVVLHEFGHSLTARRFGVQVRRILLLPIGGMAEFDHLPRSPGAELLITAAGPLVNIVIAVALLPFVWRDFLGASPGDADVAFQLGDLLPELCIMNLWMGVFNLVPAFPMDGGRILRAILSVYLPYLRATWWAVMVGRVISLGLAALALLVWQNFLAAALFLFVFVAGSMEYRVLRLREEEAERWQRLVTATVPPVSAEEPPLLPPT